VGDRRGDRATSEPTVAGMFVLEFTGGVLCGMIFVFCTRETFSTGAQLSMFSKVEDSKLVRVVFDCED
jgi:hypothetical protein